MVIDLIPKTSIALLAVYLAVYSLFNGINFIPSQQALFFALLILAYLILGAGIKYVDDAFDEQVFSKKKALFLSPVLGILWAYSMILSPESATLLGAILLSVIIKLKIDNPGHQIGAISIVSVLGGMYFLGFIQFLWLPLVIVMLAGVLDEINRDYLRRHFVKSDFWYRFLRDRYLMDLSVFLLAFFNFMPFIYFIAFYAFGFGYDLITRKGIQLKISWKFAVNKSSIFLVH